MVDLTPHLRRTVAFLAFTLAGCSGGIDKDQGDPVIITENSQNGSTSNNSTGSNNANGSTNGATNANNTSNAMPNSTTGVDPVVQAACDNYCEIFVGRCVIADCVLGPNGEASRDQAYEACTGQGDPTLACPVLYENNADFRAEVDSLATASCQDQAAVNLRCELYSTSCAACPAPTLGTACTQDADCDSGPLSPVCFEEQADGRYPGGQCWASGCEVPDDASEGQLYFGGSTGCGQTGACFVGPGLNTFCLPTCASTSDCHRAVTGAADVGYSCRVVGTTSVLGPERPSGFCEAACVVDADCPTANPICDANRACREDCETNADCPNGLRCISTSPSGQQHCDLP